MNKEQLDRKYEIFTSLLDTMSRKEIEQYICNSLELCDEQDLYIISSVVHGITKAEPVEKVIQFPIGRNV